MKDITLTNKQIVEQGMLQAAVSLLQNKLAPVVRFPLEDAVEYMQRRAKKYYTVLKEIADKYNIPEGTPLDSLKDDAKKEVDALRDYPGRIQMDLIPHPAEAVEGALIKILEPLFVKRESKIKDMDSQPEAQPKAE
jgi:hypothetical protein